MTNPNNTLPQNIQDLITSLSTQQAMPLGKINEIPFVAIRLEASKEELIRDETIISELKPSIFNVDYQGETIALCFVQFRLNRSKETVYTVQYDLKNEKQFSDVWALLEMQRYGLLIATEQVHDFQQFDANFEADFHPRDILAGARGSATDYDTALFDEVAFALRSQTRSEHELWDLLNEMTPFDQQWYGRLKLGRQ